MNGNTLLVVAASLSFIAALLHVAIIFGGAEWYRFFGAGERMAVLATSGSPYPTLVTLSIASVLGVWGLYGLSGAGIIGRLPFLRWGLVAITLVYLLRGAAGLVLPFVLDHPALAQNSRSFWLVSSSICLTFGLFYLLGVIHSWGALGVSGSLMGHGRG